MGLARRYLIPGYRFGSVGTPFERAASDVNHQVFSQGQRIFCAVRFAAEEFVSIGYG